jgi:hypothetical protein
VEGDRLAGTGKRFALSAPGVDARTDALRSRGQARRARLRAARVRNVIE